jgi:hypothetical protein
MGSDVRSADLRGDERGAVVVIALFMAVTLVGVLWYLMGAGDAIIYRETMQDGADATAFSAAVYHARGMNLIAMINIVMAAIMAIIVAIKATQVILAVATGVACAVGAVPVCLADVGGDIAVAAEKYAVVSTAEAGLKSLLGLEIFIGGAQPQLAFAQSIAVGTVDYRPTVLAGGAVSISMVPGTSLAAWNPLNESTSGPGLGARLGPWKPTIRVGLPLYETDGALCRAGATMLGELVREMFGHLLGRWAGAALGAGASRFASLAKNVPSYFCDGMKSLDVYPPAVAGSDYYGVYSIVFGYLPWQTHAGAGVSLATWGRSTATTPSALTSLSFAKSEFYFDLGLGLFTFNGNPTATTPQKFPDDGAWNMRWRARMRRVRAIPQFGGLAAQLVTNAEGVASKNLLAGLEGTAGNVGPSWPVKATVGWLTGAIKSLTRLEGQNVDNGIQGAIGSYATVGVH